MKGVCHASIPHKVLYMKERMIQLSKLFVRVIKNTAFITLFATTLGVLFAFYLNGIAESINIERRKDKAFTNIITELEKNENDLINSLKNDSTILILDQIRKYDVRLRGEINASRETMDSIMLQINVVKIIDSIDMEKNVQKYLVYYDFGFSLSTLPSVAWEAAQMADITNELEYKCLSAIIEIYDLQNLYMAEEHLLIELYVSEKYYQFYRTLLITRALRKQLLEKYEEKINDIKTYN